MRRVLVSQTVRNGLAVDSSSCDSVSIDHNCTCLLLQWFVVENLIAHLILFIYFTLVCETAMMQYQ